MHIIFTFILSLNGVCKYIDLLARIITVIMRMIDRLFFVISILILSSIYHSTAVAAEEAHSFLRRHRNLQAGGSICDANSNNPGTICSNNGDCPVSIVLCNNIIIFVYAYDRPPATCDLQAIY